MNNHWSFQGCKSSCIIFILKVAQLTCELYYKSALCEQTKIYIYKMYCYSLYISWTLRKAPKKYITYINKSFFWVWSLNHLTQNMIHFFRFSSQTQSQWFNSSLLRKCIGRGTTHFGLFLTQSCHMVSEDILDRCMDHFYNTFMVLKSFSSSSL